MRKVAIHSAPRSGSSWLGEIFNSSPDVIYKHQPLFSYLFKDRLSSDSRKEEIDSFFEELAVCSDDFIDKIEKRKKGLSPIFPKNLRCEFLVYKEVRYHHILENLLDQDKDIIVVGIIRNPMSVLSSWLQAPREFKAELGWERLEEWRYAKKKNLNKPEEFNGFEKWKEVAYLFQNLKRKYPSRFYLLEYADLIGHTQISVQDLFEFCDISFTNQTLQFLSKSTSIRHNDEHYSVYRAKNNDVSWQNELEEEIIEEVLKELKDTPLFKYTLR